MKRLGGVLIALALTGCATVEAPACPAGQERLRTAQLFLGGKAGGAAIREADIGAFVDEEITPRFPDGVTILDGGGQWRGAENRLIREAQKVVLIVVPRPRGAQGRLEAVRAAYKARFKRDSVMVTQVACVTT